MRARLLPCAAADDICSQPPNQCNEDGYLTTLVLAGDATGNLVREHLRQGQQHAALSMAATNEVDGGVHWQLRAEVN